jgi:hypothetical protein
MILFRLGIPLAVFAFVLYQSRFKPIYFTLLPWIVGLGRAIFIDILPDSIMGKVFGFQISSQDVLFGLVVIVWLYSCWRRKLSVQVFTRSSIFIAGSWFFLLLVEEIVSITNPAVKVSFRALLDTRFWLYFPISFMLFVDTYKRYNREEFMDALETFSWIVAGVTVLYILDYVLAWNIIYPYEKRYEQLIGLDSIPREFYFSFFWLGLVFSYLVVMPRSIFVSLALLAIISFGIIFSYTRSVIMIASSMAVIATILLLIKSILQMINKRILEKDDVTSRAALNQFNQGRLKTTTPSRLSVLFTLLIVLPALASILLLISPILFPMQWDNLAARFMEVLAIGSQGLSAVSNFTARLNFFILAWSDGMAVDPWLGSGLILSPRIFPWMSYDSDWIHAASPLGTVARANCLFCCSRQKG